MQIPIEVLWLQTLRKNSKNYALLNHANLEDGIVAKKNLHKRPTNFLFVFFFLFFFINHHKEGVLETTTMYLNVRQASRKKTQP